MREFETTLGGNPVTLAATFKASQEIAQKIADPLVIGREAHLEALLTRPGFPPYDPKFKFTVSNVPLLLHIGLKAAGSSLTLEQVQELVFDEGFVSAKEKASDYLALIISPRSEQVVEGKGAEGSGE
jgi:hypothetical protein